ncbi:1,2-phenylacetyl-CoA epoxidase subunit PaaC [Streptomyces platensis]|uniref:1,2-phenylacetyl-CoA epoxidase subunit PaaC n=1 Tax=Streptomyces platensis TaxID=58346 RepID=UPI002E80CFFA|nr:1,2-phenylacetyl-CoA epoxidase subunit PaaC [Streptomyces platensis]WUB83720.1 phenylacetate-CoA oxygenase subunit PaaC [Streptomyces platensis]
MRIDLDADVAEYALRLGDDALILCQRLCAWVTHAPTIEEDLALSNIALDLLGHARVLLAHSGRLDGTGRSDDDLAYRRAERTFRNALLLELPNGDFGVTVARQLVYAVYAGLLYTELELSHDAELAGFAGRAAKEVEYHQMHAARWTVLLGRGTEESRRRMQAGVAHIWPYAAELFESDELVRRLAANGLGVDPARLHEPWEKEVATVLTEAGLAVPSGSWRATGGRAGLHTKALGPLLADFQSVYHQYPGGTW